MSKGKPIKNYLEKCRTFILHVVLSIFSNGLKSQDQILTFPLTPPCYIFFYNILPCQLSDSSILLLCIILETEIIMKENLLYGIINILCPKNNLEFPRIIMNQFLRKLFEDQSFYDSCFYIETTFLSKDIKSFFSFF